jgi:HD-GYP domain-containing protein (c-di-GMP phosphodiesterase class II)
MSSSVILYTNERQAAAGRLDPRLEVTADGPFLMIDALARAMAARDESTAHHAQRVQRYAVALAAEVCLGDARMIAAIDAAALVHDVGKLGIADRLLQKPGPLTADEYDRVKQHAVIGADILVAVALPGLAVIVRHHHENWDGSGYPDGLSGATIPLGARVLSVVDCYDALTSDRPYRRALSHTCAMTMIRQRRGTMYDPAIVDAFLRIVQGLQSGADPVRAESPRQRSRAAWARRASRIRRGAQEEARAV